MKNIREEEIIALEGAEVEVIQSKLRIAKDGSKRGLKRRKSIKPQLIDMIQAAVEKDSGIKNWDPVVMMAVIASRADQGYPAVDANGNAILDQDGNPVMVPPNPELAAAVAAKVAPFLHGHVKPREIEADKDSGADPDEKKDKLLSALENMGVKVVRDE